MTSRVSIVLPPSSMLHDENYGFTANHHHKFHEKYVFGRTLGTGGFSVVLAASLRDDTSGKNEVAVKVIDRKKMSQVDEAALRQEVEIMRAIDHPNICKMLDFYEEESHFYIILELIQGGELFDHLLKKNNYSESDAREMIDVIVNVVEYLHSKNIVHRDLKAENLLMMHLEDDAELKLCDFGASAYASEPTLTDTVGTPNYVAPEILQCQPYGKAVDIWAIGVITFLLLSGNYPFDDHNQIKLFTKIKKGKYDFHDEHWDEVSEEAKSFIRACLDINPETRLKAEDAYSHPWLQLSKHHFQVMNLKAKEKLRKFNWKRRATAAVTVAGKRTSELRRRRSGGRALLFANMPSSFDTGMHMGGMGGGGMGGGSAAGEVEDGNVHDPSGASPPASSSPAAFRQSPLALAETFRMQLLLSEESCQAVSHDLVRNLLDSLREETEILQKSIQRWENTLIGLHLATTPSDSTSSEESKRLLASAVEQLFGLENEIEHDIIMKKEIVSQNFGRIRRLEQLL